MRDAEPRRKRRLITVLVIAAAVAGGIILAGWLLYPTFVPVYFHVQDSKNVTLCMSNLKSVATSIELYRQRFKRYPETRSGLRFLLAPLKAKILEHSEDTIFNMYVCPGDDLAVQAIGEDVLEAYADLANIDPLVISYAGRNTADFPLDSTKAKEEPIACDAGGTNGGQMNHRRNINVVFLDMHIESLDISSLPGGAEGFKVGPDAPHPWLRVLNKDP